MMQELMQLTGRTDVEPKERQERRLGARQLRARQREDRRAQQALMEIAWCRLC